MKTVLIVLSLVLIAIPAGADVYSWTDATGVRHWSNKAPTNPAGPVEVAGEIPAGAEIPRRPPSRTTVFIPRWHDRPASVNVNVDTRSYRITRTMIEAERQLMEDRRERIENAYWRSSGSSNRRDPLLYREIIEEMEERREELRWRPSLYFQKRELRGRR